MRPELDRFDGIQALRFFAAALVVLTHSTFYASERLVPGLAVWKPGVGGVDVFFVISGFVMAISARNLVHAPLGWRVFLVRRLVRIVPLYWSVTSLKLLVMLAAPSAVLHAQIAVAPVVLSYLFLPSFNPDGLIQPLLGVGWTLNYEMFFYALFALALACRARPVVFIGAVLLVCAALQPLRQPDWPAAQFYLDAIVLEFLFGMLVARAVMRGLALPAWGAALLILCGAGLLVFPPDALASWPPVIRRGLPALAVVTGVVFLEPWWRGRVPAWLLFFGNASYALYLVHPLVAPAAPSLLRKLNLPSVPLSIAMSVAFALVASAMVWHFFERPLTARLQRRLSPRLSATAGQGMARAL